MELAKVSSYFSTRSSSALFSEIFLLKMQWPPARGTLRVASGVLAVVGKHAHKTNTNTITYQVAPPWLWSLHLSAKNYSTQTDLHKPPYKCHLLSVDAITGGLFQHPGLIQPASAPSSMSFLMAAARATTMSSLEAYEYHRDIVHV